MQQVVLDRERPQGSSEKVPESFMLAAVAAVFGLRSGSLAVMEAAALEPVFL